MPIGQNVSLNITPTLMQAQSMMDPGIRTKMGTPTNITSHDDKDAKVSAAAQDFEAMFIAEMIKPMIESVEIDETFGGGKGEDVFRGMMTQEYGKIIAKAGGIGLASHIKEALIKMQDEAKPEPTT